MSAIATAFIAYDPANHPGFLVTSAENQSRLLVEAKGGVMVVSPEWAAELRDAAGSWWDEFYLLATPTQLLLWLPAVAAQSPASVVVQAPAVLSRYLDLNRIPLQNLSNDELAGVVESWLGSVMFKPEAVLLQDPAQAWLVESGLHRQIFRGYINPLGPGR